MHFIKIIALFLLFVSECNAQNSFFDTLDQIFLESEKQWICQELKSINKAHFASENNANTWILPTSDSLKFGNQMVYVSEMDRAIFREFIFPDGKSERYLTLVSLCDLYFPLFRKKAEESGLSTDYKYLPLLLSGCNQGYKRKDRSGIWALDYLVARKMHLRIDTLIDERNGGDFTTAAALNYLKELDQKYAGDMLKSISAYRLGIPAISRLTADSSKSIYPLLPDSEKKFIQLLAYLKSLIESTRTQNQLQNYFDIFALYEGVVMEKNTRTEALKQVLGLDIVHSAQVNPVFVGNTIPAMYRRVPFLLPMDKAGSWKLKKDSIAKWQTPPPEVLTEQPERVQYHVVKRGESLGSIAKKHRTTVRKIRSLNKLRNDKIREGQKLIVSKRYEPDLAVPVKTDTSEIKMGAPAVPKHMKKKNANETITYKVKNGDSLWKIANKYKGITPEDIKKWNNCGDDLRPGQKLILHLPG